MYIPLITFTLGLAIGLGVKGLTKHHQCSSWLTNAIQRRQVADNNLAACKRRANRLAAELATAEMETRHLRRQLGYDADGDER